MRGSQPVSALPSSLHYGGTCCRQNPTGVPFIQSSLRLANRAPKAEMSLEPPSGHKQHNSRRNMAPKGMFLVRAHDTFAALNCTGQMGEAVLTKGNAEKTTGPWTSNVSLPAYLGEWVIRFHGPPGTWVTHVRQELPRWCLQSASSCNYILHLLRMSRLDCKSWGKHDCRFL